MSDFSADEVRVLKALASGLLNASGSGQASSNGASNGNGGGALEDRHLDNDWANKTVAKDPKMWTGQSFVGSKYSECSPEYLEALAGLFDFKARKGREENPPRLQSSGKNAGKPWYEKDEFEAKLCRAWAKRNRTSRANGNSLGSSQHEANDAISSDAGGQEDDIPFAVPFDIAPNRHIRRMNRWERW